MIEVLVNDVTVDGLRRVRVVNDLSPIPFSVKEGALVRTWSDDVLGLHYLEATWACREAVSIRVGEWRCARKMVLWKLAQGERVSEALKLAMAAYGERFKRFPDYALMRKLPKAIEDGFEVDDVMFLISNWVPAGCLALCKGDDYGFETVAV